MSWTPEQVRWQHRAAVKAAHDATDERARTSTLSAVELYLSAAEAAARLPETVPAALRESLAAALTAEGAEAALSRVGQRSLLGASKTRMWLAFTVLDAAE